MLSVFRKKNADYTKKERVVTSIFSFIVFGIVGGFVRLLTGSISLGSMSDLFIQFLPYIISFGIVSAVLAYFYPKVFQILMCFLPVPGGNS